MEEKEPEGTIKTIEKALVAHKQGLTMAQLIEHTGLSRSTIKTRLDQLVAIDRVHEETYGENIKVYFLNGVGDFQQKVALSENSVLWVDVFTNPWGQPFVRIKHRVKNQDKGAVIVNEKSIDELVKALEKAKPRLRDYEQIRNMDS